MQDKFIFIHGAFQSPTSWKIPRDFSNEVVCMDCSTLVHFQDDVENVLNSIDQSSGRLIIVATSLGCIHGIKLANRVVSQYSKPTSLVFCAVPSLVTYQWQTTLLCGLLKYLGFVRSIPLPKWLAQKIWSTDAHRENICLLSASPLEQERLSEQVRTHIVFTFGDFLAGTNRRQAKWVGTRSRSPVYSNTVLFTHYPYIFDRKRFWNYLHSLGVNGV